MKVNRPDAKFQIIPLLISLAITLSIGFVASLFTRPEIAGWYSGLKKASFNPPAWLFPIAWTILYILIAIAAYLVWKRRDGTKTFKIAAFVYVLQLLLNFSWSIVFFGLHQVLWALVVIIALLVIIVLNINWFGRFNKASAWLLVPYLLWVGFATLLNISIYVLNK